LSEFVAEEWAAYCAATGRRILSGYP